MANLFNTLNTKLIPICQLLALLEAHHILHVSTILFKNKLRLNTTNPYRSSERSLLFTYLLT